VTMMVFPVSSMRSPFRSPALNRAMPSQPTAGGCAEDGKAMPRFDQGDG
jgi:hypothetical protein